MSNNKFLQWLFPRTYGNETLQKFGRVTSATKVGNFVLIEGIH